jgi:hypothetical protein
MRPRGSITGPLILIVLGALFLVHTLSPDFEVLGLISHYWPFFLIGWGVLQLIEVLIRGLRPGPVPINGISGGGWGIVLLIVFLGWASWQWRNPGAWWHRAGIDQSIQLIGDSHNFSFDPIRQTTGKAPRIVIESFRGDAKITGGDASEIVITGHKSIRALDAGAAAQADKQANVEAVIQGNTVVIRCNQDHSGAHIQINTDLEITVPRDAVLEATGRYGDFDISNIKAADINSDNAGVKVQNVTGDVKVDTRRSDQVQCSNVKGAVTLRGRGEDVELTGINGQVSVAGEYSGTITLRSIASPVRLDSMRTQFEAEAVAGSLTLQRGSLDAENLTGPLKVTAQATDISLNGFNQPLELTVDKGDVDLKPGHLPLSKMNVRTRSGDVNLTLPERASFALKASTSHGEIENDFGDALKEQSENHGARLEGALGEGPQLTVISEHGGINLRKDNGGREEKMPKSGEARELPRPSPGPQI